MKGLDAPAPEQLPGSPGDTEQLIQAKRGGSRQWLRQYQQVCLSVEVGVPLGVGAPR
jgi:hypothetical protein